MSARFLLVFFVFCSAINVAAKNVGLPNLIPYYSFKTKLWGMSDSTGKLVIPIKYEQVEALNTCLVFCVFPDGNTLDDNQPGADLYKPDGSLICNLQHVSDFVDGCAPAIRSKKFGMIDSTGKILIPFEYTYVSEMKDGYARAYAGATNTVYNNKGKIVLSSDTMTFSTFYKGRCWVRGTKGRLGSADTSGKIFWHKKQYPYTEVKTTSNSEYATIGTRSALRCMGLVDYFGNEVVPPHFTYCGAMGPLILVEVDGKKGLYSRNGIELFPAEYYRIEWMTINRADDGSTMQTGYTRASTKYLLVESDPDASKNKCAVIDTTGKMVLPFDFWRAYSVYDGIFQVCMAGKPGGAGWGFIDSTGAIIAPLQYKRASGFRYGVAAVQDDLGYHLIDREGKPVNQTVYNSVMIVNARNPDGLFIAWTEGGCGLINPRGEVVIPFNYDYVYKRAGEPGFIVEKNKLIGVVSETSEEILPVRFSWLGPYRYGYRWATLDSACVVVDSVGNIYPSEVPCKVVSTDRHQNVYAQFNWIKQGDTSVYLDDRGKIIPELVPYDFAWQTSGFILVRKNHTYGAMDLNYQLILPVQYYSVGRAGPNLYHVKLDANGVAVYINTNGTKYYEE